MSNPTEAKDAPISPALADADLGDVIYDCNGDAWVRVGGGIEEVDPISSNPVKFEFSDYAKAEAMFGPFSAAE